jgi:hypothetical protein
MPVEFQNISGSEILCGDQQGDIIAPNHGKKPKSESKKE